METVTADSFTPKQNKSSCCSINNLHNNFDPEDDFGPKTNIDNIDDGVLSQSISTKRTFGSIESLNNGFDTETQQNNSETDNKDAEEDADGNKNVLSNESDDEEWNYFKGDKINVNSETNNTKSSQHLENSAGEEMDYKLNPHAAEFVPVTPNSSISPVIMMEGGEEKVNDSTMAIINELSPVVHVRLLNDEFVAWSPLKGQEKSMESMEVPLLNEFDIEVRSRPSNVFLDAANLDEISFWNKGDVCVLNKKEDLGDLGDLGETPTTNDTAVSMQASVFSDDSSLSNNLSVRNKAVEESIYEAEKLNVSNVLPTTSTSMYESEKSNVSNVPHPSSSLINESEKPDILDVFPLTSNINAHTNEDVLDNEDYRSIIGEEVSVLPSETSHDFMFSKQESDVFVSNIEKSDPSFQTISFSGTGNTAPVLRGMIDFADNEPTHSTILVDGQPVFKTISKTSSVDEQLRARSTYSSNPVTFSNGVENENVAEEDIKENASTDTNDVDFIFQRQVAEPFFNLDSKPPAHNPFSLNCGSEEPQMQSTRVVEINVEPSKNVAPLLSCLPQPQIMEQSLASHILLPSEIPASSVEQGNVVTPSDNTDNGDPMTRHDAETPYRHDCSRMNEKPDSVRPEQTHAKRYADLTPDYDYTSTMESDKLESELHETEAKWLLPYDLQFKSIETNEVEESALMEEPMVMVPEGLEPEPVIASTELSNIPAAPTVAAVSTPVAVAIAASTIDAENEAKKLVIKKPKVSAKATTKPSLTILNKAKPAASLKPSNDLNPKMTVPRTTAQASRARATVAARATSKTTNTNARNTLPVKPSAPAKAVAGSTTIVMPTAAGKISGSPVKSKMTTTSIVKETATNGDISSSKLFTTRKALGNSLFAPKKSLMETVNSSTTKPSINMSTRISLAPKSKPLATSSSNTPNSPSSTTSAVKRPTSAPKVGNKGSKDITNKCLSTSKGSLSKIATNSINGKIESNVASSSLKSAIAAKIITSG